MIVIEIYQHLKVTRKNIDGKYGMARKARAILYLNDFWPIWRLWYSQGFQSNGYLDYALHW